MKRRTFLALAAALSALAAHEVEARASTAILATLDELVAGSSAVVIATAKDRYSQWEDLPSGKRIVTYTKLKIEKAIVGAPGAEVWVRTLGGAVGSIGQAVPGEAQIKMGSRSLLFLVKVDSAVLVTGMSQGHYPIVADDKGVDRLVSSPDAGALIPRRGPSISARETLVGAKLEDATSAIVNARRALDAKK